MNITQVGVATTSEELVAHLIQQVKDSGLVWGDLDDAPDYAGKDTKFLQAQSGGGSASMVWADLPATGLNWVPQNTDITASNKIGYLASSGITITLPAAPEVGDLVAIADHYSEFNVTPVTVLPGGGNDIEGDQSLLIDLRNAYVQLIYDGDSWEISQLNHPFNLQEITEETFTAGGASYILSRVPASSSAILVSSADGRVYNTSLYSTVGNVLTFNSAPTTSFTVRFIGIPAAVKVSEVPVGALMYFPNSNPVDGWLDCIGGTISRDVYPDLVAYLAKNPLATTATLPDARSKFIRTWDGGTGLDTMNSVVIPSNLQDNSWGHWLNTTNPSTSENLWDFDTVTRTTVSYVDKRIGYAFDSTVVVNSVDVTGGDLIGINHLPSLITLVASKDGVTWIDASAQAIAGSSLQNQTITLTNTLLSGSNEYRFWSVVGDGGIPYVSDPDYYWGATTLVFNGSSTNRLVGGYQADSVGVMDTKLSGLSAGAGQIAAGTGSVGIVDGGAGEVTGGNDETRPENQAYVLKIKAFHNQGGSLTNIEITNLITEVARLASLVDSNSYNSGIGTISSGQASPATVTQSTPSRTLNAPAFVTFVDGSPGITSVDKVIRTGLSTFEIHYSGTPSANTNFSYSALEV